MTIEEVIGLLKRYAEKLEDGMEAEVNFVDEDGCPLSPCIYVRGGDVYFADIGANGERTAIKSYLYNKTEEAREKFANAKSKNDKIYYDGYFNAYMNALIQLPDAEEIEDDKE